MTNRSPITRLISALLATVLLLNSVAVTGLTACGCRTSHSSGDCCCSRTETEPGSSRSCCRKSVQSESGVLDSRKTTESHSCCKGRSSGHRDSSYPTSGCSCRCRHDIPLPAVPVETNRSAENLAIDLAANLSVGTVFRFSAPRQRGDVSAESDAITALDRCACLCRFTL
jgi:hypothetical protein